LHPTVSIRNPTNIFDADYRGDGRSGLFLWGGQMQKRDAPTAYVSTRDLMVDRPAYTHPSLP
jgi:hypothetical protein